MEVQKNVGYNKNGYMFVCFFLTQIKTGAPCRSERLAKYNQILRLVSLFHKDV